MNYEKEIYDLRRGIEALEARNLDLQRQINSIKKMQDFDREKMLEHIADRLRELDDYVFPTFHKVFPDYAKTVKRVDGLIRGGPHGGHAHDKRNTKD